MPIHGGIMPESLLLHRSSVVRVEHLDKTFGIGPIRLFLCRCRYCKEEKLEHGGIGPVKLFSERSKCKSRSLHISIGIWPCKSLLDSDMCFNHCKLPMKPGS
uniref:Uncharacterized protein n=1 Tax=Opuntia streptacantha TaxID=393608 RepID=A0A7C9E663_OPUST